MPGQQGAWVLSCDFSNENSCSTLLPDVFSELQGAFRRRRRSLRSPRLGYLWEVALDSCGEIFETTPSAIPGYVWLRCRTCGAEAALAEGEEPPGSCPTCAATTPICVPMSRESGVLGRLRAALSRVLRR